MKNFKKFILFIFVIMSLTMALSIFSSAKAKETTYIAAENYYENTYAKAYVLSNRGLCAEYADGSKNIVHYYETADHKAFAKTDIKFFIRGSAVYYSLTKIGNSNFTEIHKLQKDGSNTIIAEGNFGDIVGGYGADIITMNQETLDVYRIHNGIATRLFTAPKYKTDGRQGYSYQIVNVYLFGGKLYDHKNVYDLDTGKVSKFTATSIITTKKYMYYTSGVNNLVMLDLNGNKTYLDKKVTEVIGGNTNKNAVYIKNEAIYRVASTGKTYKLTTTKEIRKNLLFNSDYDILQAVLVNGQVYIAAYCNYNLFECDIISVKNTGGKLKQGLILYDNLAGWNVKGNMIFFTEARTDGKCTNYHYVYDTSTNKICYSDPFYVSPN